jgi:hypothetical protein
MKGFGKRGKGFWGGGGGCGAKSEAWWQEWKSMDGINRIKKKRVSKI